MADTQQPAPPNRPAFNADELTWTEHPGYRGGWAIVGKLHDREKAMLADSRPDDLSAIKASIASAIEANWHR